MNLGRAIERQEGVLGVSWGHLGASQGGFGPVLGSLLGAQGAFRRHPWQIFWRLGQIVEISKNLGKTMVFHGFLMFGAGCEAQKMNKNGQKKAGRCQTAR